MTTHCILIRALIALILLWPGWVPAATLKACVEPDPPPWTYWARDGTGKPTQQVVGFSVDLIKEVFARMDLTIEILGLPLRRCENYVDNGKVDFELDVYHSPTLAKTYDFSRHYSRLSPQIFFDQARPVTFKNLADLKKYRGCGINGQSYRQFGLVDGTLDLSAMNYDSLVKKIKAGHCDYFADDLEVLAGYRLIGQDMLGAQQLNSLPATDATLLDPASHRAT